MPQLPPRPGRATAVRLAFALSLALTVGCDVSSTGDGSGNPTATDPWADLWCVPDCTGRVCGDNGCGSLCGTCEGDNACTAAGQCLSTAAGSIRGTLMFEAQWPEVQGASISLGGPQVFPGARMLAVSLNTAGELTGAAQADDDGKFVIPLSAPATGDEQLLFTTLWAPSLDAENIVFSVLKPQDGGDPAETVSPPWAWLVPVPAGGDVGQVTITEEQGSGAMYVFLFTVEAMRSVTQDMLNGNPDKLKSLAVLWSPGIEWSCGACYASGAAQWVDETSKVADQSVFISGESGGASAWGYPVILHEFGHYMAQNYSRDDSPGGSHSIGQAIAPAFAWSEGWAGFFAVSTMSRWLQSPEPIFWDIQQGASFWLDYSGGAHDQGAFVQPNMDGGLDQLLDECWVATMLWHVWDGADVPEKQPDGVALGTDAVMKAVASKRFLSYDRGAPGADFVDFCDAVICGQPSMAWPLKQALNGLLSFPYDGGSQCP